MNNQTKIVVCGSPHSGKTVFITNLYMSLPQKYTAKISACPDGEGVYSNNKEQKEIELTRRKGKMTPEFVEEVKTLIKKETAPIVLVDVGGLRSKENEEIMQECELAIILDKSPQEIEKWRKFCKKQGLEILAEFKSILSEEEISSITGFNPMLKGNVINLNRGEDKKEDLTINSLKNRIYKIAIEKGLKQKGKELLSDDNVLNMREVAKKLKMMNEDNIEWENDRADEIYYLVKGFAEENDRVKVFEARANWVIGLICETMQQENIEEIQLYDTRSNGYIPTRKIEVEDKKEDEVIEDIQKYEILPDKIKLYIKQTETSIMMQFELNPKYFLKPEDMEEITLPNLDKNKKIYLSGRLPLWLLGSITRTYENPEKSILQPGNNFIQYASCDTSNLGKIESEIPNIDFEGFLKTVKEDTTIPQGGEAR